MDRPVVIVGAGIAGLVCARRLTQADVPVVVLEAGRRAGGKIQTDVIDGFRIDHGFQVLFDAYPHASHELNLPKLNLCRYEPGALIWDGSSFREIHQENLIETLVSRYAPMGDLMKAAKLSRSMKGSSTESLLSNAEMSAQDRVKQIGFSAKFLERFIRPFFGGILLDRSLADSSRLFDFYWKMLAEGRATTPALGMGEITKQVADELEKGTVQTSSVVASLIMNGGRCEGVVLDSGLEIKASAVVLATDAATTQKLTGHSEPVDYKSCVTVTFACADAPYDEPILLLNGPGKGMVNHAAALSNVSRQLAPTGQNLFSATVLGDPQLSDVSLARSVQYEMQDWFPKGNVPSWRPLAVHRIREAQLRMPPGALDSMSGESKIEGLVLAGDYTTYPGIDGAVKSGQQSATRVLETLREPVTA